MRLSRALVRRPAGSLLRRTARWWLTGIWQISMDGKLKTSKTRSKSQNMRRVATLAGINRAILGKQYRKHGCGPYLHLFARIFLKSARRIFPLSQPSTISFPTAR